MPAVIERLFHPPRSWKWAKVMALLVSMGGGKSQIVKDKSRRSFKRQILKSPKRPLELVHFFGSWNFFVIRLLSFGAFLQRANPLAESPFASTPAPTPPRSA